MYMSMTEGPNTLHWGGRGALVFHSLVVGGIQSTAWSKVLAQSFIQPY
jgi:hypothetical protein